MTFLSNTPSPHKSSSLPIDTLLTTITAFEREVIKSLAENESPGLAVGIFTQDEVHYCKGFGVKRRGLTSPVTPNTLFQLASISKPLSATH